MFLDELTPFLRELAAQPAAFLGGLASGLLRLDLADDPVKQWLQTQGATPAAPEGASSGDGPQKISID